MQDSAKYLIHADIRTSGVVERTDVVGAIYGQTEGLLGDELDLRTLQESSKVGRIDVDVESEGGRTFGTLTIASGLDRVETAVLAAALETIDQVGPSRADISVTELEDVRSAKRRTVVERAADLLADFEADTLSSRDIVEAVREQVRVEDATTYEGLPAGPRVADSDAIVVVEGRADVVTLLQYGVKNAIAVEGTDVPDPLADLTAERTVTAFLDGDRGGDLILEELAQVGSVDYVATAPRGTAVEDLDRDQVLAALRRKVPYSDFVSDDTETVEAPADATANHRASESVETTTDGGATTADPSAEKAGPQTLADHVGATVEADEVRFLDAGLAVIETGPAESAFARLEQVEPVPETVICAGPVTQRLLDLAAQRGVGQVVGDGTGEFVKQPTDVRVRSVTEFEGTSPA